MKSTRSNISHARARELGPAAAREPANERTEHEAHLGRKRDIGRDANDDAKQQTHQGSKADGGSNAQVRESMLVRTSPTPQNHNSKPRSSPPARSPVLRHATDAASARFERLTVRAAAAGRNVRP